MVTSAELQCGIRRVHSMLHAMATFLDVLVHLEALGRRCWAWRPIWCQVM